MGQLKTILNFQLVQGCEMYLKITTDFDGFPTAKSVVASTSVIRPMDIFGTWIIDVTSYQSLHLFIMVYATRHKTHSLKTL
jgi:hypothetical protein